jgi:hypothetical protein
VNLAAEKLVLLVTLIGNIKLEIQKDGLQGAIIVLIF